jgi:enoyl-CoA hydratase
MSPTILCERIGGVGIVTLNRPEVRNALSSELRLTLRSQIADLDGDPDVAAIVLTGTDPAFCAGVDLRELEGGSAMSEPVGPHSLPFVSLQTPVIGAINGPTYTGGLELALLCHFLIASDRATFADTHARLGLLPGWGMSVMLNESIGVRRAREMSLTSRPIDAQTAYEWGLVNRVVPHEQLMSTAMDIATAISANDHDAVERHTRLYDEQSSAQNADAWRLERDAWIGTDKVDRSGGTPGSI